jgi:hypothetical protein
MEVGDYFHGLHKHVSLQREIGRTCTQEEFGEIIAILTPMLQAELAGQNIAPFEDPPRDDFFAFRASAHPLLRTAAGQIPHSDNIRIDQV